MSESPTILIGRCSFWPEARDPEAWLRALVTLGQVAEKSGTTSWTSPRAVGDTLLRGHLSRRGGPGLFGLDHGRAALPRRPNLPTEACETSTAQELEEQPILLGVGLLELSADHSAWQLSTDAQNLLTTWQTADHRQAMDIGQRLAGQTGRGHAGRYQNNCAGHDECRTARRQYWWL